jgi:hypothetical protein
MAIATLAGVIDAGVYVLGYFPTGVDVGADFTQIINKVNEDIAQINTNTTGISDEAATREAADDALSASVDIVASAVVSGDAANQVSIDLNATNIDTNATNIAALSQGLITHVSSGNFVLTYDNGPTWVAEDSSIQTVLIDNSFSFSEGDQRIIICDNEAGIYVKSLLNWNSSPGDVAMRPGQIMRLWAVAGGAGLLWEYELSEPPRLAEYITLTGNRTLSLSENTMIVQGGGGWDVLLPPITSAVYGHKVTITRDAIAFDIRPSGSDLFMASNSATAAALAYHTYTFIATSVPSGTGGYKWIKQVSNDDN